MITTKFPFSFLPWLLTRVLMVSPAQYDAVGKNWAEFGKKPSGTGPFKITRVVPGQYIEMVRNENYWDKDAHPETGEAGRLARWPKPPPASPRCARARWTGSRSRRPIPFRRLKQAGYDVTALALSAHLAVRA